MWAHNQYLFNKLADQVGNRYLAVKFLARASRNLARNYDVCALESELLTWALTGDLPDLTQRKYQSLRSQEIYNLYDTMSYVQDKEVVDTVVEGYKQSVKAHHLLYHQNPSLDEYRQGRANILLRMVWAM